MDRRSFVRGIGSALPALTLLFAGKSKADEAKLHADIKLNPEVKIEPESKWKFSEKDRPPLIGTLYTDHKWGIDYGFKEASESIPVEWRDGTLSDGLAIGAIAIKLEDRPKYTFDRIRVFVPITKAALESGDNARINEYVSNVVSHVAMWRLGNWEYWSQVAKDRWMETPVRNRLAWNRRAQKLLPLTDA